MKYHWSVKLLALVLAFVTAGLLAVSGLSVITNLHYGAYSGKQTLEEKIDEKMEDQVDSFAWEAAMAAAVKYIKESATAPGSDQREIWEINYNYTWHNRVLWPEYEYTIRDNGKTVLSTAQGEYEKTVTVTVYVESGTIVDLGSARGNFPVYEELPPDYVWTGYRGEALPDLDARTVYYKLVEWGDYGRIYRMERFEDVPVEVDIHLTRSDLNDLSVVTGGLSLMQAAWNLRKYDGAVAIGSALCLLAALVYLCLAAGRTTAGQVIPRGTNRWPLDLFFCLACVPGAFCLMGCAALIENTGWTSDTGGVYWYMAGAGAFAGGAVLSGLLWLMALCAQVRQGGGAWYKQSILGRCGLKIRNWCVKLVRKIFAVDLLKKCWYWLRSAVKNLSLMWQWGLGLAGLVVIVIIATMGHSLWGFILALILGIPVVLYGAHGFGRLREAAGRMARGDLDAKIDTAGEYLYGNFAEFAGDLNALGDTCVESALARMKSERMKTELITNVSHDIKTPLTSIINYVDLLKSAETGDQRAEYLEVLESQSQRLKKLIEDLMEMSKASSGNVAVELSEGDLIEAVNQALGEFADRMAALELEVVFRQKQEALEAEFDGKLLWRVLSNVLGNVVKYAMPGTRVYIDAWVEGDHVYLSVKNISRDPLNITAEELMERFVRGDESRGSEGNGLGLNIARSLMEVQGGTLELTVDGDLFKVILGLK